MRGKMMACACACVLFMSASGAFCAADPAAKAADSSHQKWWAQLNLNDDQKAKLKELRAGAKDFRKANFEKMKSLLDKSKEELLKPAPNKTVLYGFAKEMGELHKAMAEHMAEHMLKVKAILSKEQFQKFMNRDFREGMGRPGAPHGEAGGAGPHHPHDGDMDD